MTQFYPTEDTIAAIATPLGEGGVAIIRLSGAQSVAIAERVFSGSVSAYATHTAHYGTVHNAQGVTIDDALVLVMLEGRSYTGEDVVEIQCHGGSLISRRVLDAVLAAGARAAFAGEFTYRAFLNGRLDLAQAEAVQQLIHAKNDHALNAAEQLLQGRLSERVLSFQRELVDVAAILEAWVDFPDEGLEFASMDETCALLEGVACEIDDLVQTFHNGRIIHEGLTLCLVGCPNVGKSSLMNVLLDKERAIVSDIAGTTRDLVEDQMRLNGLNIKLVDTAGIRATLESVEMEGIRRSKRMMGEADLIILVLDASRGLSSDDKELLSLCPPKKTVVAWNKSDLPHEPLPELEFPWVLSLSAKEKKGLKLLHEMVDQVIWEGGAPSKEELVVTSVRHHEALKEAHRGCLAVISGLREGVSAECVSSDMQHSLRSLRSIIGFDIGEDILSSIFSKFCIGK